MIKTKDILRLTLTLLVITAVVAAALAGVNAITNPIIAKSQEQKIQDAVSQVLPGGGKLLEQFPDETGLVEAVYASEAGYAIQVAPNGFGGKIVMMVGIQDGKVSGLSIISHAETPSLGAVIAGSDAAGNAFRDQFAGHTGNLAVTKDGGSIDAVTGATISSRAVVEGVNAALACATGLEAGK